MLITNEERRIIKLLGDSTFSLEFIEAWEDMQSDSVMQTRLDGFMSAVRLMAKPDVQHAVYRDVAVENMLEDVKQKVRKLLDEQGKNELLGRLLDDKGFVEDVRLRWQKSLEWSDESDTYWQTCEAAINEVMPQYC